MPTLHIDHAISDLAEWRHAFDPLRDVRRGAGVVHEVVRQPLSDPHRVLLDLDFDTTEHAEQFLDFLQRNIWAVPANSPALVGSPTAIILTTVHESDLNDEPTTLR
jgi:hypothetical protein